MTGFRWGRLVAEGAAIVVSILLAFAIELMGLVRQMRQNAWVYVGEMERVAAQVDTVLVRVESGLR